MSLDVRALTLLRTLGRLLEVIRMEAIQHIGVTRSGKAVQLPLIDSKMINHGVTLPPVCALYTRADHFDAYAVFEYLVSREIRRQPRAELTLQMYETMSECHRFELTEDQISAERSALALPTIFQVIEHGKSIADHIFVG
jgi:hypothetical protein